MKIIYINPHKL